MLLNKHFLLIRFLVISLSTLVFISACENQAEQPGNKKRPRPPQLVSVETAKAKLVAISYQRSGTVRIRDKARLHAQEEGRVSQFPWFEGDRLRAGVSILKLDDSLLKAELKKARAEANQASLDLKRILNLKNKNAASADEVSRARTRLSITRAEVEILETRLAYMNIRAPFNGVISERLVDVEDYVTKNTHVATLINPDSVYIDANFSEQLLSQTSVDMPVTVHTDSQNIPALKGRISRIHPVVDDVTRQGIVEVELENKTSRLLAGQYVRLEFTTPAVYRIMLPFNSIQQDRNNPFVYRMVDGKAIKTTVTTGIKLGDQIEVNSGIDEGEQIITQGFLGLADGRAVQLKQDNR